MGGTNSHELKILHHKELPGRAQWTGICKAWEAYHIRTCSEIIVRIYGIWLIHKKLPRYYLFITSHISCFLKFINKKVYKLLFYTFIEKFPILITQSFAIQLCWTSVPPRSWAPPYCGPQQFLLIDCHLIVNQLHINADIQGRQPQQLCIAHIFQLFPQPEPDCLDYGTGRQCAQLTAAGAFVSLVWA